MSPCLPFKILVHCLAVTFLFPLLLNAEVTSTVSGTVMDSSGATIASATVILRNTNTGLERRVQTSQSGTYEFLAVPVGENYSVRVEARAFETVHGYPVWRKPASSSTSTRSTGQTSSCWWVP